MGKVPQCFCLTFWVLLLLIHDIMLLRLVSLFMLSFFFSFTLLPQLPFLIWCGVISLLKFDNITQLKLRLETIMAWLSLFFHNFKCIHNLCFFNAWRIYDYQDVSDLLILNEFKKSKIGWPRSCKASIFPDVFADFMSESSYINYGFACCISSQIISDKSNLSS